MSPDQIKTKSDLYFCIVYSMTVERFMAELKGYSYEQYHRYAEMLTVVGSPFHELDEVELEAMIEKFKDVQQFDTEVDLSDAEIDGTTDDVMASLYIITCERLKLDPHEAVLEQAKRLKV